MPLASPAASVVAASVPEDASGLVPPPSGVAPASKTSPASGGGCGGVDEESMHEATMAPRKRHTRVGLIIVLTDRGIARWSAVRNTDGSGWAADSEDGGSTDLDVERLGRFEVRARDLAGLGGGRATTRVLAVVLERWAVPVEGLTVEGKEVAFELRLLDGDRSAEARDAASGTPFDGAAGNLRARWLLEVGATTGDDDAVAEARAPGAFLGTQDGGIGERQISSANVDAGVLGVLDDRR